MLRLVLDEANCNFQLLDDEMLVVSMGYLGFTGKNGRQIAAHEHVDMNQGIKFSPDALISMAQAGIKTDDVLRLRKEGLI